MRDAGDNPRWLADGVRLVFVDETGALRLIDSATGRERPLLSAAPEPIVRIAMGADDREIFFVRSSLDGDLWMLSLD